MSGARLLVPLACALLSGPACAATQARYAVVMGANLGEADEAPLIFAEEDAARMAQVLTRFGGVPPENLILLRGGDADDARRALASIKARIAAASGGESLLVVYYSGHADARAIHLRHTRLPFGDLRALVDDTGADLRVLVMDACRAGELTRVKGAVPAEPFAIDADDRLASEGTAIITSAAAGEDAQESDALRGGVFSHHLVTGLRGAADGSGDQRVTLSEAYRYAYQETLRTTSRARFVQHPTYEFRIRGREDLVLTRLTDMGGLGRLGLPRSGRYLLLPQSRSGRVAEVATEGKASVLVEPGDYMVRRRTRSAVYEAPAQVKRGEHTALRAAALRRIPYGATVRKGYLRDAPPLYALSVAGGVAMSTVKGLDAVPVAALGLRRDFESLTYELRARYGRTEAANDDLRLTHQRAGLEVGALKLFDLTPLAVGVGLRAGADAVWQSFETQGEAPDRFAVMGRASTVARVEVALLPWLSLGVEGGAEVVWRPAAGDDDALGAAPTAELGVVGWWP